MDSEKFEKIIEHADKYISISKEAALDEMARKMETIPTLWQKYSGQGFALANELSELNNRRDQMKGELMLDLKTNPSRSQHPRYQVQLKSKDDYECQYLSYPKYNELAEAISVVEAQAAHISRLLENVKNFGYTLKNLLDLKKLQAGVLN